MPRHGVDYEAVKRAATKLLSQGISPSVAHIRTELGTGSNTTIAAHLKEWREAQATKSIYHLPETMPKALIGAFEALWQSAMEHAEQQFIAAKAALKEQEEQWQQEKQQADQIGKELQAKIAELNQTLEERHQIIQQTRTDIAVRDERLKKQEENMQAMKQHHENRLNQAIDEKQQFLEKITLLEKNSQMQQQKTRDEIKQYDIMLEKERDRQAQSESRWATMISDLKKVNQDLQKKYETIVQQQAKKLTQLQDNFIEAKQEIVVLKTTLAHNEQTFKQQEKITEQKYNDTLSQLKQLQQKTANQKKHKKPDKNEKLSI